MGPQKRGSYYLGHSDVAEKQKEMEKEEENDELMEERNSEIKNELAKQSKEIKTAEILKEVCEAARASSVRRARTRVLFVKS